MKDKEPVEIVLQVSFPEDGVEKCGGRIWKDQLRTISTSVINKRTIIAAMRYPFLSTRMGSICQVRVLCHVFSHTDDGGQIGSAASESNFSTSIRF